MNEERDWENKFVNVCKPPTPQGLFAPCKSWKADLLELRKERAALADALVVGGSVKIQKKAVEDRLKKIRETYGSLRSTPALSGNRPTGELTRGQEDSRHDSR